MNSFHAWLDSLGLSAPWIQAYGSIIALAVAIWISSKQARRESKRERDKLQAYMQAVLAICSHAYEAARIAHRDLKDKAFIYEGVRTSELKHSIQSLTTVTLETLPDANAFMEIYRIRRTLKWVLDAAEQQGVRASAQGVDPELLEGIEDALSSVDTSRSELAKIVAGLR